MALIMRALFVFLLIVQAYSHDILELFCTTSSDCQHLFQPEYNIRCMDRKCVCINFDGRKFNCKPAVQKLNNIIGGPCPCTQPNTKCNKDEQICYCDEGFSSSADRRRCIKKKVELWDNCEENPQCFISDNYSECNSRLRQCHCIAGFQENNGICNAVVGRLDENCSNDRQCHKYSLDAICQNKTRVCICQDGFVATSNQMACIQTVDYNATCTEGNQCVKKLGPGSECNMEVCTCSPRYFATTIHNKTICQRIPTPGDYCQNYTNCQTNLLDWELPMECVFGECNCKIGYYLLNDQCIRNGSKGRIYLKSMLIYLFISLLFNSKM